MGLSTHIAPQVYFLKCGEYTKIGITRNSVADRVMSMKTGNPYKIEHVFSICTILYKELEEALHEWLAPLRYQGEWYKLSDDDLLYIDSLFNLPVYEETD